MSSYMSYNRLDQWLPTCGTRTPGLTQRTGGGYAKIILLMAKNTKKRGVKIKTQKLSYEVLVYKETYVKIVTRPARRQSYNYFNAVIIRFDLVLG
jgi:hypothetical protein